MWIGMARGAAYVHEAKGMILSPLPLTPALMAVIARNSGVGAGRARIRVAMFGMVR